MPGTSIRWSFVCSLISTSGSGRTISKIFSERKLLWRSVLLSMAISFNVDDAWSGEGVFLVLDSLTVSVSWSPLSIKWSRNIFTAAVVLFMETSEYLSPRIAFKSVVLPTETWPISATRMAKSSCWLAVVALVLLSSFFMVEFDALLIASFESMKDS